MLLPPMGFRLQSLPCCVAGRTFRLTSLTALFLPSAFPNLSRGATGGRNLVGARIAAVRAADIGMTRRLRSLLS